MATRCGWTTRRVSLIPTQFVAFAAVFSKLPYSAYTYTMSGFFSSEFSLSKNEDTHIPFYSPEYEQELLSSVGLGESVVPPTVSAMGTPSKFSDFSSTSYLDDPNYFLEFAEPAEFLPPLDFDYEPYTSVLADVKPEVQEKAQSPVRSVRYEPYSEPSKEEEPRRKRGRPMKNGSASKMASYSRQYRETKKKELAVSQTRTEKLERENADLRDQIKQLSDALQRMESEMSRLRSQQQYVPVAVDQLY